MKKILYYLIPLFFMVFLAVLLIPRKIQYEKTLNVVCLPANYSRWILDFEPIATGIVTVNMERREHLLVKSNTVQGAMDLAMVSTSSGKVDTIQYITGYGGIMTDEREEKELHDQKRILKSSLSHWDEDGSYRSSISAVYNENVEKMFLYDEERGKMYFCSESEPDLAELMAYFEGYYELSPVLEEPE